MTTGPLHARTAVAVIGIGLALAACGTEQPVARDDVTPSATPSGSPSEPAEPALPASYSFTYGFSCYCPDIDVTYRVVVEDGAVTSAVVDEVGSRRTRRTVKPGDEAPSYSALTIQDMIDARGLSGEGKADQVDVTWPEGTDHPTRIAVDRLRNAIDDEITYEILTFTPA